MRRGSGPFLLVLLPAALLALVAAFLFQRPRARVGVPPPVAADPDETIEAFGARLDGLDGSRLVARLAPLHADPDRQRFEAGSLKRRLELEPGQPWRLSLRWDGPAHPRAAGDAPGALGADGAPGALGADGPAPREAPREPTGLGLGPVEVRDGSGLALASIRLDDGERRPADPLRTLLAPPEGALRHGQTVGWVLWGRRPGEGARVVGLLPPPGPDADAFEASTGLRGPLVLEPKPVRRSEMQLPLAQLDRSGKIRSSAPSEGDRGRPGAEDD